MGVRDTEYKQKFNLGKPQTMVGSNSVKMGVAPVRPLRSMQAPIAPNLYDHRPLIMWQGKCMISALREKYG